MWDFECSDERNARMKIAHYACVCVCKSICDGMRLEFQECGIESIRCAPRLNERLNSIASPRSPETIFNLISNIVVSRMVYYIDWDSC